MRTLLFFIALAAGLGSLAGCAGTSDPYDPAIQAMEPVNACGPSGAADINQCRGHPRH